MVDGPARPEVAVFFAEPPFVAGSSVTLGEDEARHIRAVRLAVGDRVGLRDGRGSVASGTLTRAGRTAAQVEVSAVAEVERGAAIHLLVPVADRDRMLWLGEKAAELNVASWRPVLWNRSRSVSPRGEGAAFTAKLRARMTGGMLQSRSAWLPDIFPDAPLDRAIAASPAGARRVLHHSGEPMLRHPPCGAVVLAVGPEGGLEDDELAALTAADFRPVSLGASILRFETAAVGGVSVARAAILVTGSSDV